MFTEFILLYKVNAVYLHCVYPFIRPKKDNFNISHSKPITANSNIALSSEMCFALCRLPFRHKWF